MKRLCVIVNVLFVSFSTLPFVELSFAQEAVSVSLEELIKDALTNNRELAAAREELQAAKHRVPQSSALPDPTFGYAIMGPDLMTSRGPQEEVYEGEQMIPFPGKLLEKRKMAAAEVEAASAKLKSVERDVILKVSETYYDLYAAQNTIAVVEEILETLKKFESSAQSRYASQQGGQRDVAKAQAEVSMTLERLFVLRQRRDTLTALLSSLLNRKTPIEQTQISEPSLPELKISLEDLLSKARQNRPELLEAIAMRDKEKHANSLAKYENAPDISVGFQYTRIGSGETSDPEDGQDAWMIPLKVTLPLWQNRIGPAVLEAKRNFKASEAKLTQEENMTEYEIKNAYYRFNSARQVVELYQNALIPQSELAFRSDQAGYEAGRVDVINLIDSENVYLNARIAYYQAFADALKSFAAIERVIGEDIKEEGL